MNGSWSNDMQVLIKIYLHSSFSLADDLNALKNRSTYIFEVEKECKKIDF